MAAAARVPRTGRLPLRVRQVASAVGVAGTVVAGTGAPVGATIDHYGTTTSHDCTFNSAHTIFEPRGGDVSALTAEHDDDCQSYVRVAFEYPEYSIGFSANSYVISRVASGGNFKSSLHATRAVDGTLISRRLSAF
jgi:hypothetical protein